MKKALAQNVNITIPLDDLILSNLSDEEKIRTQQAMNYLVMNELLMAESLLN